MAMAFLQAREGTRLKKQVIGAREQSFGERGESDDV